MMKKLLIALFPIVFLLSVSFAAAQFIECPPECMCLSSDDVMNLQGQGYTINDCPDTPLEPCNEDPLGQPMFCYLVTQCGNGECEPGEDAENCPEDCLGSASAGTGEADPGSHGWGYDPASTDFWNEMLQIKISAGDAEDVSLKNITLKASGTGNDANDIDKIEVYVDENKDGNVDDDEVRIGQAEPAYNKDDGTKTIGLTYNLGAGNTKYIIISYTMKTDAPVGKTYKFTVTAIGATGKTSGKTISVANLPISSGTKTIQSVCGGWLDLDLSPNPVNISQLVTASANNLTNCANKRINVQPNACDSPLQILSCSCAIPAAGTGCACNFTSPETAGDHTYWACIDKNGDGDKTDGGESASVVLKVLSPAVPPPEKPPTGEPGEPQCGDCEPTEWGECKTPAFTTTGTQTGTCEDLCGNVLTKTIACEITVESVPPKLPEGAPKVIVGQKDYAGPVIIGVVAIIVIIGAAGGYIWYKRKGIV